MAEIVLIADIGNIQNEIATIDPIALTMVNTIGPLKDKDVLVTREDKNSKITAIPNMAVILLFGAIKQ